MADILTHLRELGFGYGVLEEEKPKIVPDTFLEFCHKNIENCQYLTKDQITNNKARFAKIEYDTLCNAYTLGRYVSNLGITSSSKPVVAWHGRYTQSGNPFDISIDSLPFSLKEDSFILHNMGLYQLLNILTDSFEFKRGLHIFETFAEQELHEWFEVTRDETIPLLREKSYEHSKGGNYMKLAYTGDTLLLDINGYRESIDNFSTSSYNDYKQNTTSKYREKVFSKFINAELSSNQNYIHAKQKCAEKAGERLTNYINERIQRYPSPKSLYNLFRINPISYYYAKNGNGINEVYYIPSQEEFSNKIKIISVTSSVPKSQLNILTTIENTETGARLILRNELRYSHGQLNGTPEAKMYVDTGSLEIAYKKIV